MHTMPLFQNYRLFQRFLKQGVATIKTDKGMRHVSPSLVEVTPNLDFKVKFREVHFSEPCKIESILFFYSTQKSAHSNFDTGDSFVLSWTVVLGEIEKSHYFGKSFTQNGRTYYLGSSISYYHKNVLKRSTVADISKYNSGIAYFGWETTVTTACGDVIHGDKHGLPDIV